MSANRIGEFDTWRAGYGSDTVTIVLPNTDTLASIFLDEALSVAAANPQTLIERTAGGIAYGKFAAPLYIGTSYQLLIDSVDRTGVVRLPIVTLAAEDASAATVKVTGGSEAVPLADQLARRIDVRDFGEWKAVGATGASGSTNNATLGDAIGAAAGLGGGVVEIPAGTYAFTDATLSEGVVLHGAGESATILQAQTADHVIEVVGLRAGLVNLTLDGVVLNTNSIGVYLEDRDQVVLDNVTIKRFETGIHHKGGTRSNWRNVSMSNCVDGYKAQGTSTSDDELRFNRWTGGTVELCSTTGVTIQNDGRAAENNVLVGVIFDSNTGTAAKIIGARSTALRDCRWKANTVNLDVNDATPTTTLNSVRGLEITGGDLDSGTIALQGTLETVAFRRVSFNDVAITLTSPANNVHVEDCHEEGVTLAGDSTAWRRHNIVTRNSSSLITTDGNYIKAWAITLDPGQHVFLEMKPIGRRRDGLDWYFHQITAAAKRPGSTLPYNTQTGNFTVGNILTGATSGATARIIVDADVGVSGTLTLIDIVGTFANGEAITDGAGGVAVVNGTISDKRSVIMTQATLAYDAQTANFTGGATVTGATSGAKGVIMSDTDAGATGTLLLNQIDGFFLDNELITDSLGGSATANLGLEGGFGSLLSVNPQSDPNYAVGFIANDTQIELVVRGKDSHTVEWTLDVDVTSSYHALT